MSLARKKSGRPPGVSGRQSGLTGNTITKGNSTTDNLPTDVGFGAKTPTRTPAGFGKFVDVLTPGGQKNP